MLIFKDIICKKGSASVNEDVAAITEHGAFVLDGATGLNKKNFVDDISDARWFVNRWGNYLSMHLGDDDSLKNIMINGIKNIKTEFLEKASINSINEIDMPSSGLAVIRWDETKTTIEFCSLGDCIIAISNNNNTTVICDEILVELDKSVLAKMGTLINKNNLSFEEAKLEIMDEIITNRLRKNKPDGYKILSFDDSVIDDSVIKKLTIDSETKILLASDGFTALFDKYNIITVDEFMQKAQTKGLEHFYNKLRSIEEKDSNTSTFPRFKKSDDSSAVFLKFN